MRFRIKKFEALSDFETMFFQGVRFQNEIFTTCQILGQKVHNMSDFEMKILKRVRFCEKII